VKFCLLHSEWLYFFFLDWGLPFSVQVSDKVRKTSLVTGSRKLRFPDSMRAAQDGGNFVGVSGFGGAEVAC
jgi:hypothetical protein